MPLVVSVGYPYNSTAPKEGVSSASSSYSSRTLTAEEPENEMVFDNLGGGGRYAGRTPRYPAESVLFADIFGEPLQGR